MFGTGFRGRARGDAAWLAEAVTDVRIVLAVDIPSGVDGLTGAVARTGGSRARHRVLRVPEAGLLFEPGRSNAGAVEVADIGIHRWEGFRYGSCPGRRLCDGSHDRR